LAERTKEAAERFAKLYGPADTDAQKQHRLDAAARAHRQVDEAGQ
jgi:hypothetical protein